VKDFLKPLMDDDGLSTIETALLLVMVSIAAFAGYQALGQITAGFAEEANGCFVSTRGNGGC